MMGGVHSYPLLIEVPEETERVSEEICSLGWTRKSRGRNVFHCPCSTSLHALTIPVFYSLNGFHTPDEYAMDHSQFAI